MARLYFGSGLSGIDAKGRVAIPNQLRAQIIAHGGGAQIGLAPAPGRDCLSAFDMNYVEELPAWVERAYQERDPADLSITRESLASDVFPNIQQLPFDGSGRFVISPLMKMFGGLGDLAFFHGSGAVIDVWDPAKALAEPTIGKKTKIALEWQLKEREA